MAIPSPSLLFSTDLTPLDAEVGDGERLGAVVDDGGVVTVLWAIGDDSVPEDTVVWDMAVV